MLINMPRELERDMSFNWAFIWVTYPGVSPEEIEKLITKPIEDEIADVNKIESITSTAARRIHRRQCKIRSEYLT